MKIVDENGDEVPRGTVGEIVAAGEHVMLGYWKQPEATAEAVRAGWMHAGDGGYMDERGYVYVVDRIKDMIISGGENVYSIEVENVVAKHQADPAGAASVSWARPDPAGPGWRVAIQKLRPASGSSAKAMAMAS